MSNPLVVIRDLHVKLGDNHILRGVNAELGRGQITAIIGMNGSGKTTLLRAILKEVPYTGRIEFRCGHDHHKPTPEHVGYVPQKLNIDARLPLTVRDLLALALQRRPLFLGVSRKTTRAMQQMLDRVWMKHSFLDQLVEKLSGGELQRVLLALALHPEPELLLLDEPAAGVDQAHQKPLYELIVQLSRDMGVTVLLVSHDISMVSERADHIICLKDGRVQCEGPPQKVTSEALAQTFGAELGIYAHHHH
jgi:zinc transport system ATP-binding protein